ncbi:MAG TPA: M56 family metallopeptidase [Steroidobacteraceae bacterium]|nr:M56 family metallopeptidase [Steroidobacteraceae bacterium]
MIAAVIDHLWQSTVFVAVAWSLTALLRKNGARLRYWIWLAASLKFLVPFSLIALIGSQIGAGVTDARVQGPLSSTVQQFAAPVVTPSTFMAPAGPDGVNLAAMLLFAVWALGFSALAIRWIVRWREIKAIVRAAAPSGITSSIPVLNTSTLLEPGVVGILRPVLLLPKRIEDQLDAGQLRAILEHELCHVRRRDNLTTALHMLVEALFWFHPLVWWIGARLIHERERACDEAVIRSGHPAQTYAEGILKVCRHYVASRLTCVSGVSGADLQTRLEAIMKNDDIVGVSRGKSLLLGAAALAVVAGPVIVGVAFPSRSEAETPQAKPAAASRVTPVGKIQLLDGKRVRLQYENADVRALLKALAEAAQVNMLVSDQVGGTVTLDLAEMPWEQALTILLNSQGLEKGEKDGIIVIYRPDLRASLEKYWMPPPPSGDNDKC